MPNIASAKKRVRTSAKRSAINHARKSRIHTFTRKVDEAIAAKDKSAARSALQVAGPEIQGHYSQKHRSEESCPTVPSRREAARVS